MIGLYGHMELIDGSICSNIVYPGVYNIYTSLPKVNSLVMLAHDKANVSDDH